MKIGMFSDVFTPSINGVTRSIESFRDELTSRGHAVYVFAPAVKDHPAEPNVIRLPSFPYFSPKDFPIGLPFLPIIDETIRPLGLDIIHTHHPFFIGNLGHRTARELGLPKIHTYHTHLTEYAHYSPIPGSEGIVKRGLKRLSRNFCNAADQIIAPSSAIEQLLRSYGVTQPISVIPTGIRIDDFKRLDEKEKATILNKHNLPTKKQILLFAGRLALEKNLLFLLDCLEEIRKKRPDIHLLFAGGGPIEGELRQAIVDRGLSKDATVTGYLERTEIAKTFGIADLFVFPSLTETQGIVLSEAMAAGAPVVAIDTLGPKDIVTNGVDGFLVPPTINDFTDKVLLILGDPKLKRAMSIAAQKSAQNFSIESTTDQVLELYTLTIKNQH